MGIWSGKRVIIYLSRNDIATFYPTIAGIGTGFYYPSLDKVVNNQTHII
jgi:hypothetical protein